MREPHQRVFDADYLGTDGGLWSERLRRYLEHLKSERNLSDGGIDYYVRKLKVFVQWLNAVVVAVGITVTVPEPPLISSMNSLLSASIKA